MAAVSTKVKKQINDQFTKDRNYQKVLKKLVSPVRVAPVPKLARS